MTRIVSRLYPDGLPAAGLRSPDEPLLGLAAPETSERAEPADRPADV